MNEEFDELARQKLQEQHFRYDEADWQAARALIDARRGRRPLAGWFMGAGALLLGASLLWLATQQEGTVTQMATRQSTAAISVRSAEDAEQDATARTAPVKRAVGTSSMQAADTQAMALGEPAPGTKVSHALLPSGIARHEPEAAPVAKGRSSSHKNGNAASAPLTVEPLASPSRGSSKAPTSRSVQERPTQFNAPHEVGASVPVEAGKAMHHRNEQPTAEPVLKDEAPADAWPIAPPSPAPALARDAGPAWMDPLRSTAPAPAPIAPLSNRTPPVMHGMPWELSLIGGVYTTTNRYGGKGSADWVNSTDGTRSAGFGLELMHMGRNLGLGLGLHYGSYVEHMQGNALDEATLSYQQYWHLTTVDTSILQITDTLPGTPPSYSGQTTNVTMQVLEQGTDTVHGSTHLRDARSTVNRVSYLEVPLLMDVHLVQGRWSLGLRGGPTVGLLSGRRGAVPMAGGDGYLPLQQVAFREVMLGYTARANLRYCFSAGWSVGLAPVLRGQLLNSLEGDAVDRRATAYGLLLSLSYRLP